MRILKDLKDSEGFDRRILRILKDLRILDKDSKGFNRESFRILKDLKDSGEGFDRVSQPQP